MKKSIFITLGILIILAVVAVWVYLFMYGKPADTDEVFTRFGLGGNDVVITEQTPIDTSTETIVDTSPKRLRQLTTRPVAGAVFITEAVRYVEQGTGHVYEINLTSGVEKLMSGTTIPKTTEAIFSPDATHVAISSFDTNNIRTIVGSISTSSETSGELEGVELPTNATEMRFTEDNTAINYVLKETTGTVGYLYNLKKETNVAVFNIPLRDIHVLWGTPLYVYTTPTFVQTGYIYRIGTKNKLEFVTNGMKGLIATRNGEGVVVTSIADDGHTTLAINKAGARVDQALPFIPEKCTPNPSNTTRVFCATPTNTDDGDFPDSWYMGAIAYEDVLWEMDTMTGEAIVLLNFLSESGREMDVQKIGTDTLGTKLYFINKNDNTLWMFDRSIN